MGLHGKKGATKRSSVTEKKNALKQPTNSKAEGVVVIKRVGSSGAKSENRGGHGSAIL